MVGTPFVVSSTPVAPSLRNESVNVSQNGGCQSVPVRVRPTPERLDNQLRSLATAQERVVAQLLELIVQ